MAHASDVCEAGEKIITAEVENKPHLKLRDSIAYDVCTTVLAAIDTAWSSYELSGEGRCAYQLTSLIETVEYLIEEGKPLSVLYVLLDGQLSVSLAALGGKEVARLQSGEILGELSFLDSRPPTATVTA